MSENTPEMRTKLREAESKVKAAEAALKDAKGSRVKLAIWSAIGGFLLFAIGGQWFPGYQLDSSAETASRERVADAVGGLMAQLCAERFMHEPGVKERLAAMNAAVGDWSQANYIREGAWATTPDGAKADHTTADRCRGLIVERVSADAAKASG